MRLLLLTALAWAGPEQFARETEAPPPPPPAQPGIGAMPEDVLETARAVADRPLPERMGAISEELLGRPYALDPLGEGTGIDADPFARYDVFDCLTFTEEVLALALAGDPAHAAPIRAHLRYGDAEPSYVTRRHFMELQWVPGVLEAGWLRDATADYGEVVRLSKEVDDATWAGWRARQRFAHTDEQLPTGPMHLNVLPLETAIERADDLRPGSVLLTVRVDRPGVPLWITHVSFVVPTDTGTTMRHATKIGDGGTRDHGVRWYLDHLRTYTNWPVLGITVLEPVEQGPRVAAAPTAG